MSRASSVRPGSTSAVTADGAASTSDTYDGDWVLAILEGKGVGRDVGIVGIERGLGRVVLTQVRPDRPCVHVAHYISSSVSRQHLNNVPIML